MLAAVEARCRRIARSSAAAVADCELPKPDRKRSEDTWRGCPTLQMVENPDLLPGRPPPAQLPLVGFAAETEKPDRKRAVEAGAQGVRLDRRQ